MRFTDLPLERPVATVMLLVCLTVFGAVAVNFLPLNFFPVVKEPEIDIEIPFPGSHPLEALNQVVRPIEEEVAAIPGVRAIFGFVRQGNATVEAQFEWSSNIDLKKMEVLEAVERARSRLPAGVGHIRVEGDTDGPDSEILGGRIAADRDLSESWELLDRRIRRPLERIRGIASVNLYGVDPQEVRIDLDLAALRQHAVAVSDVIRRINSANLDLDLGAIRGDVLRYDVRSSARFRDVETIGELAVGPPGLRLKDIAAVALREPLLTRGRHLNRKFAIGFDVFKEPTANTVETVARLTKRIEEFSQDPDLAGIEVLVWQNQGEEILNSLGGLRNAGIFGGLMAVVVLFFFLRRISTTTIVAVAIPFSLLVTCGAMFLFGMEFNVLTMLGLMLGVGMLVDNAVVVIENIYRLQSRGMDPRQAATEGPRQVGLAVLAATATTVVVWSWLFVSERNTMTILIGQVALVICFAVVCSLLISLTFIPLAAARFIPKKELKPGFFERKLVPWYRGLLGWTLRHRAVTLLCLASLAASAAIPIALIEKTGEPRQQTRDVLIMYRIHDASTKEVLEGHVNTVEDWIDANREELAITDLYSWFSEENQGAQTRVYLPPGEANEANFNRLKEMLQEGLPTIPGVDLEVGDHRGRERQREGGYVSVALHGEDPEYLETLASGVELSFREMEHVTEVFGPSLSGTDEVRVMVHPERARGLGILPEQVAATVAFAFRGQRMRRYQGQHGEVEMIVGLSETERPGLAALRDLPILNDAGEIVTLGTVAELVSARTLPHLVRIDRKTTTRVTVQFDEDETTTEKVRESMTATMDALVLPDGYHWDWGRGMRRDDDALIVMRNGLVMSLIVVVLLMMALFESFTQPMAIMITLPLALFGAFWSLWIFGFVFEVLAFIGVIILIGIVVNNGIVMVDHVNGLRREGLSRNEALIVGCGDRLRPVLMTVITTVVGLIPLAMSQFTVAGVYVQSMAVAMIGGLASSTIFTLVALPVWYMTVEDFGAVLAGTIPRWRGRGKIRFSLPHDEVLVGEKRR